MSSKSALILAATLAITPTIDVDAKSSSTLGKSIGSIFSKSKNSNPPKQAPANTHQEIVPSSSQSGVILSGVGNSTKRTLDIVAPQTDFMRYYALTRGVVAAGQYVALTPSNIDTIAGAQYQAMIHNAKILPEDHPTQKRVVNITSRLIKAVQYDPNISQSTLTRMKWETHVIQSDIVNAFCMPGGKMAIYTGIIDKLKLSDDEIAIVMGHEIAHALRDHSYIRMKTQLGTNAAISAVGAISGRQMYAVDIANGLWQLSHSRDHEREADHDGLDLARMAGYDSCAGANVWKKMQSLSKSSPPEFLSTHPPSPERADTLLKQARRSGGKC